MGQQFEERKSVSSVKNICEAQSWTLGRYEDKSREEEKCVLKTQTVEEMADIRIECLGLIVFTQFFILKRTLY